MVKEHNYTLPRSDKIMNWILDLSPFSCSKTFFDDVERTVTQEQESTPTSIILSSTASLLSTASQFLADERDSTTKSPVSLCTTSLTSSTDSPPPKSSILVRDVENWVQPGFANTSPALTLIPKIQAALLSYWLAAIVTIIIGFILYAMSSGWFSGTAWVPRWATETGVESSSSKRKRDSSDVNAHVNKRSTHANRQTEKSDDNFPNDYASLERENQNLKARIVSLEQGQEYRSRKGVAEPSYDKIVSQSEKLKHMLETWAFKHFHYAITDSKEYQDDSLQLSHFSKVCSRAITLEKLIQMDISLPDLMVAIVADHLYSRIVLEPLNLCAPRFRDELRSPLWHRLSKDNGQASKASQAAFLTAYNQKGAEPWEPYFSRPKDKDDSEGQFVQSVCGEILDLVKSISLARNHRKFDIAVTKADLLPIAKFAGTISKILGTLASGHQGLDKEWLCTHKPVLKLSDVRIGLQGPGRLEPKTNKVLDYDFVVLYPGILKWGRANGESWENWDVYSCLCLSVYVPQRILPAQKQ